MKKLICALLLLTLSALAQAVPGRTGVYRGKDYDGILGRQDVVDEKSFTLFGLTLVDSTLQDAQKIMGPAAILPKDGDLQVCYAGPDSILIISSGYIQDPVKSIDEFIISKDKHIKELVGPCRRTPLMSRPFPFFNGVLLGMTPQDVQKIWGKPSRVAPDVLIYEIRRIQSKYFTDDVLLYFEFKDGKLNFAEISRGAVP